ncbi:hypothetical protein DW667_10105 [Coprococcus sp. AM25-15LB]|nr:hypothetical protein DW667_10105 [Coprococcus sp. AM25-15LB]
MCSRKREHSWKNIRGLPATERRSLEVLTIPLRNVKHRKALVVLAQKRAFLEKYSRTARD